MLSSLHQLKGDSGPGAAKQPDSPKIAFMCVAQEAFRYFSENSSAQQYSIAEDCNLNTAGNKSSPNPLSLISMQYKTDKQASSGLSGCHEG